MQIKIASKFAKYGHDIVQAVNEWQKAAKNKLKITRYELVQLGNKILGKPDSSTLDEFAKMMEEDVLPGFGIELTKGMHASQDLFFASEDQALQYLSDVTGLKVLVAKKWSGKVKPKWSPPEGLFTKSAETIANTLAKSSKTLKQATSRLTFYRNRAGDNLSDKDKARLEHAQELLRAKFEDKE